MWLPIHVHESNHQFTTVQCICLFGYNTSPWIWSPFCHCFPCTLYPYLWKWLQAFVCFGYPWILILHLSFLHEQLVRQIFLLYFQTNSYQGIVVTNGTESYAVFIYQCGAVSWHGNATVGFNAGGTWFENHPLSGTRRVASIACLNSTTSVWTNLVYRLTPSGKSKIKWMCFALWIVEGPTVEKSWWNFVKSMLCEKQVIWSFPPNSLFIGWKIHC